jgi:hypothetical protein
MFARRRTAAALGVALVTALTSVLGVPGSGGAATAATGAKGQDCLPLPSTARLAQGSDAVDPNAHAPANAAVLDRAVKRQAAQLRSREVRRANAKIVIPTYVHVFTQYNGKGKVARARITEQIKVMNNAYAGKTSPWAKASPFQFKLVRVNYVKHSGWYNWRLNPDGTETNALRAVKKRYHKGGPEALNIYVAGLGDGLLGYATFPGEGDPRLDGVVIVNTSLPGGTSAPYNRGDTAVHEVGHWLGLYHTFQGGCVDPDGDLVGDTPFQDNGENIYQCGTMDTCPVLPGNDPTKNFMSYGSDVCLDKFTAGQVQRQLAAWYALRDPSV